MGTVRWITSRPERTKGLCPSAFGCGVVKTGDSGRDALGYNGSPDDASVPICALKREYLFSGQITSATLDDLLVQQPITFVKYSKSIPNLDLLSSNEAQRLFNRGSFV